MLEGREEFNPFINVRSDALVDKELLSSPATFTTLCVISLLAKRKKDGTCYFKQQTIADHLGKSRQAISRCLKTLEDLGYIEIYEQTHNGHRSNNAYRILYDKPLKAFKHMLQHDVAAPQHDVAAKPQHDVAAKPYSYKPLKEKKALTRQEFLQLIDKGFRDDEFKEFAHLTESEILLQAGACLDHYGAKGEWPTANPVYILRNWIRNGISIKKIRKASAEKKDACRGKPVAEPENPLQDWHERVRPLVGDAVFISWIRPLFHDGNRSNNICAPTKFFADHVRNNYSKQISKVLPTAKIVHHPYQP